MLRLHTPRIVLSALAFLLVLVIGGCEPSGGGGTAQSSTAPTLPTVPYAPSSTSKTPAPQPVDYRNLLLTAADLSDGADTFGEKSRDAQPSGQPGASAFFVNAQDNRAISDTFMVYPDAATATATLQQAVAALPSQVTGGAPAPLAVGGNGVTLSGTYPEADKSVTVVLFTEGRAMVRLEFQSAQGDATTDAFVASVAKMQDVALRVGLTDPK